MKTYLYNLVAFTARMLISMGLLGLFALTGWTIGTLIKTTGGNSPKQRLKRRESDLGFTPIDSPVILGQHSDGLSECPMCRAVVRQNYEASHMDWHLSNKV